MKLTSVILLRYGFEQIHNGSDDEGSQFSLIPFKGEAGMGDVVLSGRGNADGTITVFCHCNGGLFAHELTHMEQLEMLLYALTGIEI